LTLNKNKKEILLMKKSTLRRFLSMLLGIIFLSVFTPLQIFAESASVSISGPSEINAGEESTFAINLSGNTGFAGFNITVNYNSNLFDYVGYSDGTYSYTTDVNPTNGSIVVSAMSNDNLTDDGTLINIKLKSKSDASGSSEIAVNVKELFDTDINDIAVSTSNLTTNIKTAVVTENYTVEFNSNGGTQVASQTIVSGDKASEPSAPTRTGYTFAGWYSDSALTSVYNFSNAITSNIILYAKWNQNEIKTAAVAISGPVEVNSGENAAYSIKISNNPGFSGFRIYVEYDVNKLEFLNASNGSYACTYDFPDSDTSGKLVFAAINSDNLQNDGTLANINFKAKDGASGNTTVSIKVDELFDSDMNNIKATTTNASTTINAVEKSYIVTFDSNGGSNVSSQSVVSGNRAFEPKSPTKSDYKFDGWYTTSSLKTKYSFSNAVTSNITLYAKWTYVISSTAHSITFDGGSGATGKDPESISDKRYGETFELPKNTYSKDGYKFDGWNDGKKTYKEGEKYEMPDNDVKFTAQWIKNSRGSGNSSIKAASSSDNKTTTTITTETNTEITTSSNEKNDNNSEISNDVKVTVGSKTVVVGNKSYDIDVAPYIQASSNSTLVPLRFVSLAISGENVENADASKSVVWDSDTKTATINTNNKVIKFTADSTLMIVDDKTIVMDNDVKAEIKDNRMFIPFRALGKALGVNVSWDADTKTAIYKK